MDSDEDSVGVVMPPASRKERRIVQEGRAAPQRRHMAFNTTRYENGPRPQDRNNLSSNATFASTIATDLNDDYLMNTIPAYGKNATNINNSGNRRRSTGDYYDPGVSRDVYDDGIRVHASRYPSRQQDIHDDKIRSRTSKPLHDDFLSKSTGSHYENGNRHNYYDDGIRVQKSEPVSSRQNRSLADEEPRRKSTGSYYDPDSRNKTYDDGIRVMPSEPLYNRQNRRSLADEEQRRKSTGDHYENVSQHNQYDYDDGIRVQASAPISRGHNQRSLNNKEERRKSTGSYYDRDDNRKNIYDDGIRVSSSYNDTGKPYKEAQQKRDSEDTSGEEKRSINRENKMGKNMNNSSHKYESFDSIIKGQDARNLNERVGEMLIDKDGEAYQNRRGSNSSDNRSSGRNKDSKEKKIAKSGSDSRDKRSNKISRRKSDEKSKPSEPSKRFGLFRGSAHSTVESLELDKEHEVNNQTDEVKNKKEKNKPFHDNTKVSSGGSVIPNYFSKKKTSDKKKKISGGSTIISFWDRKKKNKAAEDDSSDDNEEPKDKNNVSKMKQVIESEKSESDELESTSAEEKNKRKILRRRQKGTDDVSTVVTRDKYAQQKNGPKSHDNYPKRRQGDSVKTPPPPIKKFIEPAHPNGLYEPWVHRRDSANLLRPTEKRNSELLVDYNPQGIRFHDDSKYVPQSTKTSTMGRYGFVNQTSTDTDSSVPQKLFSDEKCEEATLYPTAVIASMEMDSMRHRHLVQLARFNRTKKDASKKDDLTLATHRFFPKDCLQILRLLAGNDRCVDCGRGEHAVYVRRRRANNRLMDASEIEDESMKNAPKWASLDYGTLLCDQCAFRHITKSEEKQHKEMGNVKSLMEGEWSLPDVITMLEGGNQNLLSYVEGKISLSPGFSMLGSTSQVKSSKGVDDAFNFAFDAKYKGKRLAAYRKVLSTKVEKISALHGCDGSKPIRQPTYMNKAVSPNRRSSTKSFSSTSSPPPNHVEDTNDDFDGITGDGIRVFSQNLVDDADYSLQSDDR